MNGLCSIAMLNYQMVIPCNFPSIPLLFVRSHQNHHKISSISHEFPCCLGYPSNHPPTGPQAAGSLRVAGRGLAPRRKRPKPPPVVTTAPMARRRMEARAVHCGLGCMLYIYIYVYIYMYIYMYIYIYMYTYIYMYID